MKRSLLLTLLLSTIFLTACGSTTYKNLEYVKTIKTKQNILLEFKSENGEELHFYKKSSHTYYLQEGDKYDVDVSEESFFEFGGYIESVKKSVEGEGY